MTNINDLRDKISPLPWKKAQDYRIESDDECILCYGSMRSLFQTRDIDFLTHAANNFFPLLEALEEARDIVERWCHYQGNHPNLFKEYVSPIDKALKQAREIEE